MAKPISKKKEQPMVSHIFSREEIERRAYELYLARGGADGDAVGDWQQAERELQARQP